jgi:hypothetical protein
MTNEKDVTPVADSNATIEQRMKEWQKAAVQNVAARAARRAHFSQVKPKPRVSLVAWVDLLGFREQILDADTTEKFQAAYQRLRAVQEEFWKESASLDPDQAKVNANWGVSIVALSDGVVIALQLEGVDLDTANPSLYDRIGEFLESLRLAQARCASVGNFLRGGVALGNFWFDQDILLSPALVQAYEMESRKTLAQNPVIILPRELVYKLRSMKSGEGYGEEIDPMEDLFRACEWMEEPARSEYLMLNFMPVFLYDNDPPKALHDYYQHLVSAQESAPDKAKSKYDWLIGYAKEFTASKLPQHEETIFGSKILDIGLVESPKPTTRYE